MDENWDFLLSEFRRLGGIADNVCQKEGEFGRGIFSINPIFKSRIFTPSKLLIKKNDIYLEDNQLRIKKDKEYSQDIRNFFNFYQDYFSWGSGGKENTELFENGLSLFNSKLKDLLKKYALVDIGERHQGKWDNVIKNQFLNARVVKFKENTVVSPIWELLNHKVRCLPFIVNGDGISTPNQPALNGELRQSYNNISPSKRFFNYGFYSEETIVFSVPFSIYIEKFGIHFSCEGKDLTNDSIKVKRFSNKIILEGLPIADVNHPRLPYDYFNEILRRIDHEYIPKDFLIKIFQLNISIRNKLIDESSLMNSKMAKILTKVLHYEISLIAFHN